MELRKTPKIFHLLDFVWWFFSKAKAEVEQRKKEVQENPFIVKPRNGRKGKKFGQKLNKKTSEPTILTLKESIEEKIDNESKIRNKRQVRYQNNKRNFSN